MNDQREQRIMDEVLKKFEDMKANDPNYIEKMRQEVNAYKKDAYKHMTCPFCGYTYSNIPSMNDVAHDNTCGEW